LCPLVVCRAGTEGEVVQIGSDDVAELKSRNQQLEAQVRQLQQQIASQSEAPPLPVPAKQSDDKQGSDVLQLKEAELKRLESENEKAKRDNLELVLQMGEMLKEVRLRIPRWHVTEYLRSTLLHQKWIVCRRSHARRKPVPNRRR